MEILLAVLLVVVTGTVCSLCFLIGAKVGNTVAKGGDVEVPELNPVKLYKAHTERKEAEAERDRNETILRNIEKYDGTGLGQEEIPGRVK